MGCLAAYFTHVQSCDVTRVQSATQWTASVQTSHQDVMQYRGRLFTGRHVTSRQDVTCRSYRWTRSVTSRHVTSGRHRRRRGQGGRHVTSRHVTSGRHSAAVDKEAVTSRPVRTSQAPPWTRRPSRHVTSRHVRTSRHVTSRHDVRRRTMLNGPSTSLCIGRCTRRARASLIADFTRRQARRHPQWCTTQGGLQNTEEGRELVEPDCTPTGTSMWYHLWSTGCSRSGSAPRPCQVHGILTYW